MQDEIPTANSRFLNYLNLRWFHALDVAKSDGTPFKFKKSENKTMPSQWYL